MSGREMLCFRVDSECFREIDGVAIHRQGLTVRFWRRVGEMTEDTRHTNRAFRLKSGRLGEHRLPFLCAETITRKTRIKFQVHACRALRPGSPCGNRGELGE